MKTIIKSFLITLLLPALSFTQVVAEGDTILCDGQQGQVELTLSATSFAVDLTNSGIASDDIFGGIIDMEFDFIFYGNTYNQVVLSSNNFLSFNLNNANTGSQWAIGAAIPNNGDGAETMNGILCPWQDIYPGVNGNGIIQYATTGDAPNRVFIASFCGIPMFSCTDICYTSQIKLYESTNIIETHIAQKVLCTTWNDGVAIHGLHNIDGTIAHVVTGNDGVERNFPNQWTCENDGWRFTPDGINNYLLEEIEFSPAVAGTDIIWQDQFGNNIGLGSEITVVPGGNVTYTAGASLCGDAGDWCGFEGGIEGDDVIISFEELGINAASTEITCYNQNNGYIEVIAPNTNDWIYNLYLGDNSSDLNLINSSGLQTSSSNFLFNNLSPNTYSVTIENLSGCLSETLTFNIEQPDEILSTSNIINAVCYNETGSLIISLIGGNPPYNTIIGNNTGIIDNQTGSSITFDNLNAGDYYYTSTDENGCLIQGDEIFITVEEPTELSVELIESGGVTCENAQNGFININATGGTEDYTYIWTDEDGLIINSEDLNNISGGMYNLELTDMNLCTAFLEVLIEENEAITIDGYVSECNEENGIITTSTSGGSPNYFYNLNSDGNPIDANASGLFENLSSGVYTVTVSDYYGCQDFAEFIINNSPIVDFTIDQYEFNLSNIPSQFTDLSNDINIISWLWEFGDGNVSNEQNPSHLYTNPGIYYINLTVIDEEGCEDKTTQTIQILQDYYSYSPTIFTPNNDGINDTFAPQLLNIELSSYKLIIFDRWGNNIFESYNYNIGWHGGLKDGTILPPDVYSYKVTYKTNLGVEKEETGKLTMVK